MDSIPIHLRSPIKDDTISFSVVSAKERKRILKEEVESLYKIHKNPFYEMPVHKLKNGDYLYGITGDGYAFRFQMLKYLDLFLDRTRGYYNISAHFHNDTGVCNYAFYLQNEKIIELLSGTHKVQIEGYARNPQWKLYRLSDDAILYVEQRTETVFSAIWYPDLTNFEYYYNNHYAP